MSRISKSLLRARSGIRFFSLGTALALYIAAPVIKGEMELPFILNPTGFALLLVMALAAQRFIVHRKGLGPFHWIDGAVVSFLVLLWIGVIYSPEQAEGLRKASMCTVALGLPYVAARTASFQKNDMSDFLAAMKVLGLIIAVGVAISSETDAFVGGFRVDGSSVAPRSGFFSANPIVTSWILTLSIVTWTVDIAVVRRSSLVANLVSALAVCLILYALMLTGSRVPIAVASAIVVIMGVMAARARIKLLLTLMISLLFVAAMFILIDMERAEYIAGRFTGIGSIHDRSATVRGAALSDAYELFADNVMVGSGTGASSANGYPHNIVVETAADVGLLGVILLLLAFGGGLMAGYRAARRAGEDAGASRNLAIALLIAFAASLLMKQTGGRLDHHKELFVLLGLLTSLYLAVPRRTHEGNATQATRQVEPELDRQPY